MRLVCMNGPVTVIPKSSCSSGISVLFPEATLGSVSHLLLVVKDTCPYRGDVSASPAAEGGWACGVMWPCLMNIRDVFPNVCVPWCLFWSAESALWASVWLVFPVSFGKYFVSYFIGWRGMPPTTWSDKYCECFVSMFGSVQSLLLRTWRWNVLFCAYWAVWRVPCLVPRKQSSFIRLRLLYVGTINNTAVPGRLLVCFSTAWHCVWSSL